MLYEPKPEKKSVQAKLREDFQKNIQLFINLMKVKKDVFLKFRKNKELENSNQEKK